MNKRVQELQELVELAADQQTKIDALMELAYWYRDYDYARAYTTANEARRLAVTGEFASAPYLRGALLSKCTLAWLAFVDQSDYAEGLKMALEVETVAKAISDDLVLGHALFILGYIHFELGNIDEAFGYHSICLNLGRHLNDLLLSRLGLQNLGLIYVELGQHNQALSHLEEAYGIASDANDLLGEVFCLNNICFAHHIAEAYTAVLSVGLKAVEMCDKDVHRVPYILLLSKIGNAYIELGDLERAHQFLQRGVDEAATNNDVYLQIRAGQRLGKLYIRQNEFDKANQYLHQILSLTQESGRRTREYEIYQLLSQLHQQKGDYEEALNNLSQYQQVKESVFNEASDRRMKALEVLYRTESIRKEAEIYRLQTEELEEMVSERTAELVEALRREQSLSRQLEVSLEKEAGLKQLKSNIITTVSHEFRTPLTIINTSTQLLFQHYARLTPEKRELHRNQVTEQLFYMRDMLRDIVLINSRESIKVTYVSYPFKTLCKQLINETGRRFKESEQIQFQFIEHIESIYADKQYILQILDNLLANAVNFSPRDEGILVQFLLKNGRFAISVSDQGIGIPQDEQSRIFDLFFRGSNVNSRRGLGVGLHLAALLSEAMGGTMSVKSDGINKGSLFTVNLPVAQREQVES